MRPTPHFIATITLIGIIVLAASLSGCAGLENRVACTVAKDKAFFVSEYGPVGVAAVISDADRAAICK